MNTYDKRENVSGFSLSSFHSQVLDGNQCHLQANNFLQCIVINITDGQSNCAVTALGVSLKLVNWFAVIAVTLTGSQSLVSS